MENSSRPIFRLVQFPFSTIHMRSCGLGLGLLFAGLTTFYPLTSCSPSSSYGQLILHEIILPMSRNVQGSGLVYMTYILIAVSSGCVQTSNFLPPIHEINLQVTPASSEQTPETKLHTRPKLSCVLLEDVGVLNPVVLM